MKAPSAHPTPDRRGPVSRSLRRLVGAERELQTAFCEACEKYYLATKPESQESPQDVDWLEKQCDYAKGKRDGMRQAIELFRPNNDMTNGGRRSL